MSEFLGFLLLMFLLVATSVCGLVYLDTWSCQTYEDRTGRATRYAALTCYVQDGQGTWWTYSEFKLRNAATGGAE